MQVKELLPILPNQITSYITYCLVRGVITTIGQSTSLPRDQVNNMVKRVVLEELANVSRQSKTKSE